jgi:Rap1a immunity proteins
MKGVVCGVLIALVATAVARGDDIENADFLLPFCKLAPGQPGGTEMAAAFYGQCIGLIQGVAGTLALVKVIQGKEIDPRLCLNVPKEVSIEQAIEVVVKYGKAHREQTREPFLTLATLALTDAWRCKK